MLLEAQEGRNGRASIIRLPCGPTDTYLRKELLWPHIREFADNALGHIRREMAQMSAEGRSVDLFCVHGELLLLGGTDPSITAANARVVLGHTEGGFLTFARLFCCRALCRCRGDHRDAECQPGRPDGADGALTGAEQARAPAEREGRATLVCLRGSLARVRAGEMVVLRLIGAGDELPSGRGDVPHEPKARIGPSSPGALSPCKCSRWGPRDPTKNVSRAAAWRQTLAVSCMTCRIEAEERSLDSALLVVTSTQEEIDKQARRF